jgi:hypothetical protein
MTERRIDVSAIEVVRTGADGGHLYIKGRGIVPGHGLCEVCAFFCSREEELRFEGQFRGHDVIIVAQSIEFTPGIGGILRGCHLVTPA